MTHHPRSVSPTSYVWLTLLACFSLATTALADGDLRTVALTGDQAPGADPGSQFVFFGSPSLNNSGQTAFLSFLSGTGSATNWSGIYSEGSGTLAEVARGGNQAPGAELGVLFGQVSQTGAVFSHPVLNDSGQTAFSAGLVGVGVNSTNNTGIYSEGSGTLAEVAREGNQAPGAESGVLFGAFQRNPSNTLLAPRLNNAGHTAFNAGLVGVGVNLTNDTGIYSEGSGTLAEVAREGNQTPGANPDAQFTSLFSPVLNDLGQTAFLSNVTRAGVAEANARGIYSDISGTLAEVARIDGQVPGEESGILFNRLLFPSVNNSGQISFYASVSGQDIDPFNDSRIYRADANTLTEVAREGNQAPDANTGVSFSSFGNPVLNGSGQTVFTAELTGAGVGETNDTGIYSDVSGTLAEVARTGGQAPGAEPGVLFSRFFTPAVNNSGQVLFNALLVDAEGDASGSGIYATNRDGQLVEIIRTGNLIDVNDAPLIDDFRTVRFLDPVFDVPSSGNEDGLRSVFNDRGQIVIRAAFTDDTRGIFVSNLVAVPEPSTALLTLASCLGLTHRRRRR